jgi:anti-anti-sigma factor
MSIRLQCPNGHPVRVKDDFAGKVGLCPHCRAPMRVPAVTAQAENPRATGEFVRQAPLPSRVDDEIDSSPPVSAFSTKKKTRQCLGCGNVVSQSFAVCPRCGTPLAPYRHLDVQKEGEVIVVRFVEHQMRDERIIGEIANEFCNLADRVQQQHLVLDFSGVVGMSSTMLGKLVMLQAKLKKLGGDLRLTKVGLEIRDILATTKLDRTLHVE